MTPFDDQTLMAFADGALPEDQSAAVARAVAADPALAAKVQAFRAARTAIAAIHAPPVPLALEARIRALAAGQAAVAAAGGSPAGASPATPAVLAPPSLPSALGDHPLGETGGPFAPNPAGIGTDAAAPADAAPRLGAPEGMPPAARPRSEDTTVVAFAPRAKRPVWQLPLATAASLVLGLFLSPLLMPQGDAPDGLSASLQGALTTLASGQARDGVEVITSFHDGSGAFCREYEQAQGDQTMIGVACRDGETWHLRLAVATSSAEGYVPASSLDLLDAWLSDNGAGQPLTAAEEAAALAGR